MFFVWGAGEEGFDFFVWRRGGELIFSGGFWFFFGGFWVCLILFIFWVHLYFGKGREKGFGRRERERIGVEEGEEEEGFLGVVFFEVLGGWEKFFLLFLMFLGSCPFFFHFSKHVCIFLFFGRGGFLCLFFLFWRIGGPATRKTRTTPKTA